MTSNLGLDQIRELHKKSVIERARTANQVIIVEDDSINAELMEIWTKGLNPNAVVIVAKNLQEARTALWHADQKTVVFCDYNFPEGITGVPKPNAREVCKSIERRCLPRMHLK